MTMQFTEPGESSKPDYFLEAKKVIDISDDTLEGAIERHPAAWAILARPKHSEEGGR